MCFGLFVGSLAASLAASILYVSDGETLHSIDSSNGAVVRTSTLSVSSLRAMAANTSGQLYGLFGLEMQTLGVIDPTNGNVSLLAESTGLFGGGGLAFRSDGSLFGRFGFDIFGLNPVTGEAGASVGCSSGRSLAIGKDDLANAIAGSVYVNQFSLDGSGCGSASGSSSGSSSGSGSTGNTGSSSPPSGIVPTDLMAFTYSSDLFFAIQNQSDGSQKLVRFDGSTFQFQPFLQEVGNLPLGVNSIAASSGEVFTPEPRSVLLLGAGVFAMALYRRYR